MSEAKVDESEYWEPAATQQIPMEDNVVYDQITPQIHTEDNIAYDQAAASQLQIRQQNTMWCMRMTMLLLVIQSNTIMILCDYYACYIL